MGMWKAKKRARRRKIDKQRGRLEAIARGKLESGLTPEGELLLTWARITYPSTRTWFIQDRDCGRSKCLLCGSESSAPARLRWMWILKHEQDHVIALGRENVEAFHSLLSMRTAQERIAFWQQGYLGMMRDPQQATEAFETVFGLERASKRW